MKTIAVKDGYVLRKGKKFFSGFDSNGDLVWLGIESAKVFNRKVESECQKACILANS